MRVWVPRAEPAASATANRLRALGHDPLVASVTRIAPTRAPQPDGTFDALLLTSANAARWLGTAEALPQTVFAVGRRTAEAARATGLANVTSADGDAVALAELVRERLGPGARLLLAAGAERKAEPAATLSGAGYGVVPWIVYAAEAVPELPAAVADALALKPPPLDAVLHYSRRSAALTLELTRAAGREAALHRLKHLCLSHDVAVPLVEAGLAAHFVPARPDEASLLAGLRQDL